MTEHDVALLAQNAYEGDEDAMRKLIEMRWCERSSAETSWFTCEDAIDPKMIEAAYDHAEADKWLEDLNNAEAMIEFGCMYRDGDNRDIERALFWLKAAENVGSLKAKLELGCMYRDGNGVPKDGAKAVKYFIDAALNHNYTSLHMRGCGDIYDYDADLPPDYPEYFFGDSDNWDYIDADYALGCMYLRGDGVRRDVYKAGWWFARIDDWDNFDTSVMCELAALHRQGIDTEKDIDKAAAWYKRAVTVDEWGRSDAMYALGEIYLELDEPGDAVKWLERAANYGEVDAMIELGKLYRAGDVVERDLEEACRQFEKAIKLLKR